MIPFESYAPNASNARCNEISLTSVSDKVTCGDDDVDHLSKTSLTISSEDLWECVQLADGDDFNDMAANTSLQDSRQSPKLFDQEFNNALSVGVSHNISCSLDASNCCQACGAPILHRTPTPIFGLSNRADYPETTTCLDDDGSENSGTIGRSSCSEDGRHVSIVSTVEQNAEPINVPGTFDNTDNSLLISENVQVESGLSLCLNESVFSRSVDSYRPRLLTESQGESFIPPLSGYLSGSFQQLRRYNSEILTVSRGAHSESLRHHSHRDHSSLDSHKAGLQFCVSLMTEPDL